MRVLRVGLTLASAVVALLLASCGPATALPPTLSYDPNGGAGLVCAVQGFPNRIAPVEQDNLLVRDGYRFAGWNTRADGTGRDVEDQLLLSGDTVLYARWELLAH